MDETFTRATIVLAVLLAPLSLTGVVVARQPDQQKVILITLDGVRTREMFEGLDLDVLQSTLKDGQMATATASYAKYWAPSAEERRRKLMPFFWKWMETAGSIAGNLRLGSAVELRNRHWFSYPGYAEILLGEPHDEVIKSNDPIRNPFSTVFEAIGEHLKLPPAKVATFAGWDVFNHIVEHEEGRTFVNAGVETVGFQDGDGRLLDQLQHEVRTPWPGTRFDSVTFRLAMSYLAKERPRVMYLALDETDDWAHDGRYDQVLAALAQTDRYLETLWTWLQKNEEYRGRTHILITTDHGRGRTPTDWSDHGAEVAGANETWIAMISPRLSARGEWRDAPTLTTSQVAATLASWMGVDWNAMRPQAGRPIVSPTTR
jgi:hypothetical protein